MLASAPVWVQWVVAVGAIATALTAVIVLFYKLWPALTKFVRTVNALGELPDSLLEEKQFRADTTVTLRKLSRIQGTHTTQIRAIRHEVEFNNGSSVKDAISRVEVGVAGLYERVDANEKAATEDRATIAATQQELEQTRPKPKE